MNELLRQGTQFAGAVLLLAGFLTHLKNAPLESVRYLLINAIGSTVLAVNAAWGGDLGFLLLEGSWALASIIGLIRTARARRDSVPTHAEGTATSAIHAPD